MIMSPADINRNEISNSAVDQPNILAAALTSATKAAKSVSTLKWSSRSLKAGELSTELTKNRAHLAIYLLPRAFASLNCPMASEFAQLWQFGSSKKRQIESIKQSYPTPNLSVCRFKQSEFGASETIKTVVSSMLERSIATLPQMALVVSTLDTRWNEVRATAKAMAAKYKDKDQWSESTKSFESILIKPPMLLETYGISPDIYIAHGEWPLNSDAFGAIGSFAVRAYLEALLSKKAGDDRIFVKPTRVGVRIWDDYDFKDFDNPDSLKAKLLSKVFGRLTSQFLGRWADVDTDEAVILQNSDFQTFREQFKPIYNIQKPAPAKQMVCQDFSAVSDFVIRPVEGGAEYPLWGVKAL